MANNRTITAANSVYTLAITGLFNTPQRLQGFSADDIFSTEPLDSAEALIGVDGKMSAGFIFALVKQGIMLQADSASNDLFDAWVQAQRQQRDLFFASGVVILPSLRKKWTLTKGALMSWPPMPDAGKTLKPRKYGITWESVSPANT